MDSPCQIFYLFNLKELFQIQQNTMKPTCPEELAAFLHILESQHLNL